jgi:integrase
MHPLPLLQGTGGVGEASAKVMKKKIQRLAVYEKEFLILKKLLCENNTMNDTIFGVLYVLCAVLFSTGMRISEALALSRADVEAFARQERVTIDCFKTSTTRELLNIPSLARHVADALAHSRVDLDRIMARAPGRGFLTAAGTPLTFRRAEKYFYPLMFQLEEHVRGRVDNPRRLRYNSHSFRVGMITRMCRHLPVTDVSYIVGHSNIQTTFMYLRTERDMTRFNNMLACKEV